MGLSFTTTAGLRQRSHSQVRVLRDSWPHFTVSDLRLLQPGGPGLHIYIPHERGFPVITPDTVFPFRRLLLLDCQFSKSKSKSKLCYDRRSAGQSVLEKSTHLGLTTRSWLLSDIWGFVDLGRPLWRQDGSAVLQLLLVLARAVIFGSESRRTRGHILLSQIQDFPLRRLLRLAGSRWRYSTPPPHGFSGC
jgi:hypothetical protein